MKVNDELMKIFIKRRLYKTVSVASGVLPIIHMVGELVRKET